MKAPDSSAAVKLYSNFVSLGEDMSAVLPERPDSGYKEMPHIENQ